jgi:SAM-dependent methyltransferase
MVHSTARRLRVNRQFEILPGAKQVTGSWDRYLALLDSCFDICRDKKVLELGPLHGGHTKLIAKQNPKYLEVIEPDPQNIVELQKISEIDKIVCGDAVMELMAPKHFDVVVCFGLLYHLHSPLHLLEMIVNNCGPKYLMLDCVFTDSHISVLPEYVNQLGARQIPKNWKSCNVNIVLPFWTYQQCLEQMGYKLSYSYTLNIDGQKNSKSNSWFATWISKESNHEPIR